LSASITSNSCTIVMYRRRCNMRPSGLRLVAALLLVTLTVRLTVAGKPREVKHPQCSAVSMVFILTSETRMHCVCCWFLSCTVPNLCIGERPVCDLSHSEHLIVCGSVTVYMAPMIQIDNDCWSRARCEQCLTAGRASRLHL
jgi:hypothetical protein